MSKFITYERFTTTQDIHEFIELLKSNNIPYELDDDIQVFDVSFANNQVARDYGIRLLPEDFERASELRSNVEIPELTEIEPEYYLFQFTDSELLDLISKRDEWSPFDYQLAQKILKNRGKEVTSQQIQELHEQRIAELSEPEKHSGFWIGMGYVLSFLICIIGIGIGWYLMAGKKTLPNGERIYLFRKSDRNHGLIIFLISTLLFATAIIIQLLGAYRFLF